MLKDKILDKKKVQYDIKKKFESDLNEYVEKALRKYKDRNIVLPTQEKDVDKDILPKAIDDEEL